MTKWKELLVMLLVLVLVPTSVFAQRSNYCWVAYGGGYWEPWLAGAGATAWQKGSNITLYIVSPPGNGFTFGQTSDIETGLLNWSQSLGTNLSITNSVVASAPASFPAQYILVQFGDTSACGAGAAACTSFSYNTTTGYPTNSTINVNTSVGTNPIGPLMAHEMGHTYIIADCPDSVDCNSSLTIMDPDEITESSPTSPQCCDADLVYAITPTDPQGAYCGG